MFFNLKPQFYIQFLYKSYLCTWILLFGSFGQLLAVRKNFFDYEFFYFGGTFFLVFIPFSWAKKCIFQKKKQCSVCAKKLHSISFMNFILFILVLAQNTLTYLINAQDGISEYWGQNFLFNTWKKAFTT